MGLFNLHKKLDSGEMRSWIESSPIAVVPPSTSNTGSAVSTVTGVNSGPVSQQYFTTTNVSSPDPTDVAIQELKAGQAAIVELLNGMVDKLDSLQERIELLEDDIME